MDERLAEIYGTGEEDYEKTAAAALAEGLAEDEGLDLDSLTAEQAEALAAEVLSGEGGEGDESGDEGDEGQEKMAEADLMGRIMAHAFWQENGQIKEAAKKKGWKAHSTGGGAAASKKPGFLSRSSAKAEEFGRKGTDAIGRNAAKAGKWVGGKAKSFGGHMMKHRGKYGLGAAGAAAVGGGVAAYKKMKKSSGTPNFDALVEARAQEIADELGVEKTSGSPFDVLGQAVEQAALARLADAGLIDLE